jgi:O-acetyl-ADP-ribose deacetylase
LASVRLPLRCVALHLLTFLRRFFPSTEQETESDWEEVEGGESAENGPAPVEAGEAMETEPAEKSSKVELPDVPTSEPIDDGPSPKKQKPNDGEKL